MMPTICPSSRGGLPGRTGAEQQGRIQPCRSQTRRPWPSLAFLLAFAGLLSFGQPALSQQVPGAQPQESDSGKDKTPDSKGTDAATPSISVKVKVVNLLATVRDKKGKVVSDLNQGDFSLEEDTHPVVIHYFAKQTDMPITLGLLVDTSMSQRRVLDQERNASKVFLDQVLQEKDTAYVIHFDKEVELAQDLTHSRPKLEAALDSLQTPGPDDSPGSGGSGSGGYPGRGGRHTHSGGAGTLLYDAVYLASTELMKGRSGRKALIILSDGVDRGSKESLESAIEAAERTDTLVYSILFRDQERYGSGGFGFPGGMGGGGRGGRRFPQEDRPDGKKVLERVSQQTGGRFFEVSKKEPLEQIYASIEEDSRNQYSLAFTPDKNDAPGYHKLLLKVRLNDARVQTRDGFYAEP